MDATHFARALTLAVFLTASAVMGEEGTTSKLSKSPFDVTAQILRLHDYHTLVEIQITDSEKRSSPCSYYVKKLSFDDLANTLSVELAQGPCRLDSWDRARGYVYWTVPQHVLAKETSLNVVVNETTTFRLKYDPVKKEFNVERCDTD